MEINNSASPAGDEGAPSVNDGHLPRPRYHGNTLLMKIIGPVITFVNRPWKVSIVSTWGSEEVQTSNLDVPGGRAVRFW